MTFDERPILTREEALKILDELIKSPNIKKHLLAVEAFMRRLAHHFGEDEAEWGLTGLLHDADYEVTEKDLSRHTEITAERLRQYAGTERIIRAILAHNHKAPMDTTMAKALYACDNLTGLIVACALVHPEKRLEPLTVDFILRRFKEKSFARGASREEILTCESNLGIPLPEFIGLGLEAMKGVAAELGL